MCGRRNAFSFVVTGQSTSTILQNSLSTLTLVKDTFLREAALYVFLLPQMRPLYGVIEIICLRLVFGKAYSILTNNR